LARYGGKGRGLKRVLRIPDLEHYENLYRHERLLRLQKLFTLLLIMSALVSDNGFPANESRVFCRDFSPVVCWLYKKAVIEEPSTVK
jgi:hypothetical protein